MITARHAPGLVAQGMAMMLALRRAGVPWYRLPAVYAAGREEFLRRNEGYLYPSYGAIFRRHLLRAKDPVPHPLRPGN